MKQRTLTGFEKYGKTTRRAQFLADMEQIIPWPELAAAVQTVYPRISENGGRPPIPLERMLRIYFLQLWFNLSDPAVEEALYDSVAMRSFVDIEERNVLARSATARADLVLCEDTRHTRGLLQRHAGGVAKALHQHAVAQLLHIPWAAAAFLLHPGPAGG